MKTGKSRLDLLLVEKGLVASRPRAQSLILAGKVLVDDTPVDKSGTLVALDAVIRIKGEDHPYVSRGGIKLAAALDAFSIKTSGRVALDIGASTGGFTHVLLLRDIAKVFAIDVGHNQLHWQIRQDPKVKVYEKINVRYIDFAQIGEKVDLVVVDVSFISLDKMFGPLLQFSKPDTDWVTLIKPQFEVGKEKVGKGGIVNSEQDQLEVLERLQTFAERLGLKRLGLIESPITGTEGNKEFLAHWKQDIVKTL